MTRRSAVVIGASAGGPQAIETVLRDLPRSFPAPIAVCQHMIDGATSHWADRLDKVCRLKVVEACQGERFLPGRVYVAPTGRHMRITEISNPVPTSLAGFITLPDVSPRTAGSV